MQNLQINRLSKSLLKIGIDNRVKHLCKYTYISNKTKAEKSLKGMLGISPTTWYVK